MDKDDLISIVGGILVMAIGLGTLLLFAWAGHTDAQSNIAEQCDRRGEIVLEGYVYECTRMGRKSDV